MGSEEIGSPSRRVRLPIDELTPRQRDCLRLVPTRNSKEIAQILGISPNVVDKHVKAAMRTLGVSSRQHAARSLIESEAGRDQPLAPQSQALFDGPGPVLAARADGAPDDAPNVLREERAVYVPDPRAAPSKVMQALSGIRGSRNDLTALQRIKSALLIALVIVGLIVLLLAASDSLTRLLWRVTLNQT